MECYNYIKVHGDSLKETNDNTRKIWEKYLNDNYNSIIDITREEDNESRYLVDSAVYFELLQASKYNSDPYGIANVNFTRIKPSDNRWKEFQEQRLERGFDDSETWSLDITIIKFVLPRLKVFKEVCCGCPSTLTNEKWQDILDKMITAFELAIEGFPEKEELKLVDEGLDLFREHFFHLWW